MKFYWLNMPFKQQAEGLYVFLSGKKGRDGNEPRSETSEEERLTPDTLGTAL